MLDGRIFQAKTKEQKRLQHKYRSKNCFLLLLVLACLEHSTNKSNFIFSSIKQLIGKCSNHLILSFSIFKECVISYLFEKEIEINNNGKMCIRTTTTAAAASFWKYHIKTFSEWFSYGKFAIFIEKLFLILFTESISTSTSRKARYYVIIVYLYVH